MSNTGKFADRTPGIRQAGLTSALANESSSACLDYPEPPSTPEGIKKWRKSLQQEPGKVLIHPDGRQNIRRHAFTATTCSS